MKIKIVLFAFLLVLLSCTYVLAQQIDKTAGKGYTVTGDGYVATFSSDTGVLSSLLVNGKEFLENTQVGIIPSYLFNGTPQASSSVVAEGNKIITTTDGIGKVEFTFEPKKISIVASNTSAAFINYFMITGKGVSAVIAGAEPIKAVPFTRGEAGSYRWINENAAINTTGDPVFWGPFSRVQVVDFGLEPGKSKSMIIEISAATQDEKNQALEFAVPALGYDKTGDMVVFSPKNYQVFQRQSKYDGEIFFSGKVNVPCDSIYYKIKGKGLNGKKYSNNWKEIRFNTVTSTFAETIPAYAGGWYVIDIKAVKDKKQVAAVTVEKVGIGEIIMGAGQSNSTNCGQFPTKQKSGMVSSTDGIFWQYADDPMIGVHDGTGGGSYYPALGDKLYAEFQVPVGIAATGHGGTSINQWNVGGELYNWMLKRVMQLGKNGFRAMLWHQGETDAFMDTDEYVLKMSALIKTSNYEAGWAFPWFVAKVSYHNQDAPTHPLIRAAHQTLWNKGIALKGPDTDVLGKDYRDYDGTGIHFSPKGLEAHAALWAEILIPYIHDRID